MSGRGSIIFDGFCFTQVSITPGSVGANTSVDVTVTMPGLLASDVVLAVLKPTLTAGVNLGNARATAANTMKVTFQNSTASPIVVGTETYQVAIVRPEKAAGSADGLTGGNVIF
jgi:hypothetical protein